MRLKGMDRYKLTYQYLDVHILVKIRQYFDDLEAFMSTSQVCH